MLEYYTIPQFAAAYSLCRGTVYNLSRRGELPIRKFGAAARISRADAEAWAKSCPLVHAPLASDDAGSSLAPPVDGKAA